MAESVDASVSNTDRETCAGSTPARSTKNILYSLGKDGEDVFFLSKVELKREQREEKLKKKKSLALCRQVFLYSQSQA